MEVFTRLSKRKGLPSKTKQRGVSKNHMRDAHTVSSRGVHLPSPSLMKPSNGVTTQNSLFSGSSETPELTRPEAEQAVEALEADKKADKKADPRLAIEAIASIDDSVRSALLIGRVGALRIRGVNREFIEQQVRSHRAGAEAARVAAAEDRRRGRLMAMDVSGAALLREVSARVRRFVVLSAAQALVVALWVLHTHVFKAADSTPYLSVTSPEKRSGKSRLLEVCKTVVAKPWLTGRVTAGVLPRKIEAESPTLLLDESDAAFKSGEEYSEALRGILNTGHGRGGTASCCVGKGPDMSYRDFSTFSPKMIAGIGKLPDTVADRSIPIRLQRKTRDEKVERFRSRDAWTEAERLREQLEAWAVQNLERLCGARPELPEELSDRQQDGAEPLLAIADLAGGEWPEAARHALVSLCCGAQAANDSNGTRLLSDIRQIFKSQNADRLSSVQLATGLAGIETSPWSECSHGRPITRNGLASLLKPFDISPHPVRNESRVFRGYQTADFEDAWARYLGPDDSPEGSSPGRENVTRLQAAPDAASGNFPGVTSSEPVTVSNVEKPVTNEVCNAVTVLDPRTETTNGREEDL